MMKLGMGAQPWAGLDIGTHSVKLVALQPGSSRGRYAEAAIPRSLAGDEPPAPAILAGLIDDCMTRIQETPRSFRGISIGVSDTDELPYVLATDIVRVPPGQGFPVAEIAHAVAHKLGEDGTALAARLPVLRRAVCDELIRSFARKNAIIAAAVFVPGVDLPVLTLNQGRLVLRIALAYGQEIDKERALELLGVVGAGFGLRTVARELLDLVPVAGWAVKGAVAYAGTKAIGEAAVRYFEARS